MLVVKFSQKYFIAQQRTLGEINGQVEETFSGQSIVKAFNKEKDVLAEFDTRNEELYNSAWKSQFLSGLMQPIMTFVGNLGYVAVAIVGSILAVAGTITVGDIQAFIQYVKNFTQPIQQMANVSNLLQSTVAAAERVFEFLDEEEEEQTVEHPQCIRCGKCVAACPVHLEPLFMYQYAEKGMVDELNEAHIMDCMECGACAYACPARMHLTHMFKTGKQLVKDKAAADRAAAEAKKKAEEAKEAAAK